MNLQNLIDFAKYNGIDIFSGVSVPEPLNADTVKSAIMIRSGLMTPLYLEPEVFRACITHWFTAKQWTIDHLIKIIESEYNPIDNYNRTEKFKETLSGSDTLTKEGGSQQTNAGTDTTAHSGTDTTEHSGTDTTAHSGTDTTAHSGTDTTAHSGTDTTENTISAENVSTYSPDSKTEVTHGESVDLTYGESVDLTHGESIDTTHGEQIDLTHGEQIDLTHGHTVTDEYQDRKDTTTYGKINTRESTVYGNIGVTTTQQMIEQELELLRHFDIYGWIAEQFENDNMLLIY